MTVLQPMLESPQTQRLGWTLLHSLWEGAAVAVALMLVLWLMRGAAAGARYAVSCAAMLAAFAIPILTFLALQPASPTSPSLSTPQASVPATRSPAVIQTGDRTAQPPATAVRPSIVRVTQTSVAQAAPSPRTETSRPVSTRVFDALHTAIPWLVPLWACGVALLSLRNLGGWVAIQRLKVLSTGAVDQEIRHMADRLRRRLKLNRAVRLLTSAKAVSPMVVGVFKPVILLPASVLCELSAAQLESILAHELAHVRRHDYLANLVQSVIETLMFYHPAVWWIGRRVRVERENCCDDVAVSLTRDRVGYVRALALVAGGAPALAPAAAVGSLVSRVRRILGLPERDVVGAPRWLSGVLVLAIVLSLAAVLRPHIPAAHATPAKPLPPGTLSGTVVDAQGHPIAGANVVFQAYDDSVGHRAPAAEAISDAAGHFRLGPIAPDYRHRWDLQIDAEGVGFQYVPGATYSVYPGTDYDLGRIQVEKGRVFSGQVMDWDGKPVSGAEIQYGVLRQYLGHTVDEVLPTHKLSTDAAGRFKTPPLPVGLLSIDVYVAERQRAGWGWEPIAPGGEEELKPVRLKKDVPIIGTVRDEQGRPIAGAVIAANDYPQAHSNDAGQYVLHGFGPAPEFQVQVSKPGYVFINRLAEQKPDGWRYEEVGPGDHPWVGPIRQLDFGMKREAMIEGRAVDAETGEPVRLQRVVRCQFDREPDGHILLSSCWNAVFQQPHSGEFRLSYDTPAEYHLTFSAQGYDDAEAFTPKVDHLQPIDRLVVKMKRQTGAEKASVRSQQIRGTVTRNGQPVKTGWVGLWGLRGTDNVVNAPMMRGRTVERDRIVFRSAPIENGSYTLEVPNPGNEWYVVAEEPGRAITQVGPITIAPEERKRLDVQCVEGGGIRGHVDAIPAAWAGNVWVVAFNHTGVRAEARVDASGNFALTNLPPGEYGLKAGYDGFRDSEVPTNLTPNDWKTPARPWQRATVVKVESARETADVHLALPSS
ncbi:MAG TPA: carboxypeptidase regulatory-like domain-containing protein [Tepidisphaeraceae bacterium]|jgi:beta-lactamase regulating signal transducer with metallopeptidase domain